MSYKHRTSQRRHHQPVNPAVLSKAERARVLQLIMPSYDKFVSGEPTSTDWYNLLFRIQVGLELAREFYTEPAIVLMVIAKEACLRIMNRYHRQQAWSATAEDMQEIKAGLDAVETMTGENLTNQLLQAHYAARDELKKYVN